MCEVCVCAVCMWPSHAERSVAGAPWLLGMQHIILVLVDFAPLVCWVSLCYYYER